MTHGHLESVVGQHLAAILVHQVVARQQVHLQKMETILLICFLNNLLIGYLGNLLCGRRIYLKNCPYEHEITTISGESTNMICLLHCPQSSRQTKPLLVDMLISSKQVACACADDVLSFAAAATTSSLQVYTREKTISWHLIPIIAFVSLFSSSQLYPSFIPAFIPASSQRGKLYKAHLSDLRCYRFPPLPEST